MAAYTPHKQLKAIRARLGITQMQAAAMLGFSYPYILSIETGQRELSRPLAMKIAKTFGVAQIWNKDAEPLIRSSDGNLVPFTKEEHLRYKKSKPSFFIDDIDAEYTETQRPRRVTPTFDDYARCVHALLNAADEQGTLRPVLSDFVRWFTQSITSDAMLDALKQSFDRLFPNERRKSDAFLALTVTWGNRLEDDFVKWQERQKRAAERAKEKRKKKQRK
jgi:DNA-binding XRE family transcriptional regulator